MLPYERKAPEQMEHAEQAYGTWGLKLHPPLQNYLLLDPRVYPTIRKTIEFDIPILIYTGPIYTREVRMRLGDPYEDDALVLTFPDAKLVIAHGIPLGPDPIIAAKHPNVYMDTTVVFSRIITAMPGVGPAALEWMRSNDKLLYGSDGNAIQVERVAQNVEPLRRMTISDEAKAKILGGNAAKLPKTVLVIDDEPQVVELVTDILQPRGYRVFSVEKGADALSAQAQIKPDLVVRDLRLPDTDGLVLCRELRQAGTQPILILSGTQRMRDSVLGFHLGADEFIRKPFDPAELAARVDALMRRSAVRSAEP